MAQKVAMVTGAGQEIGQAIAERLANDGFAVSLVGRHLDKVQKIADEINGNGGKAIAIKADVAERDEVFAAVDATVKEFGDFNVIINNAGLGPTTPIDTITPDQFDWVYDV